MIEIKNSFLGGLNLDDSYFSLGKSQYVDALNITRDAVAANQDLAITNIVGNQLVDFDQQPGTNKCIGAYGNQLRGTVIYFIWNSNGKHSILEFNASTRIITPIFTCFTDSDDDILNFTETGKITGINVYNRDEGDLLFFLDSLGRPTIMNIDRFKVGEYDPVTRDIIDVGKRPPLSPPTSVYGNDTSVTTNNLNNHLFRFKYRWVYDDNEKSTWGPISAVPYPVNILDPTFTNVQTNNNLITISLNSGPKNVKAIELAVSISTKSNNWDDFGLVQTTNKANSGIEDNVDFSVSFYNDSTYPFLDVNESNLLFDYVPRYAQAQEEPNGNVNVYGNITEGYDRTLEPNVVIDILTVAAGSGGSVGDLNGIVTIVVDDSLVQEFVIAFSGTPVAGTIILIKVKRVSDSTIFTAATYTTVTGDNATSVAVAISASFNSLGQVFTAGVTGTSSVSVVANALLSPKRIFESMTITPPSGSANSNSIATWLWSTSRNIGIQYYDQKGVTNGILYNAKIVFPDYAENGSHQPLLPYINIKIYHVPPTWAYSYQLLMTKESTLPFFFEFVDVQTETDFLYFDISNLPINERKNPTTATVVSYTFQDGDRLRLIRRMSDNTVYNSTYDAGIVGLLVDPVINSSTHTGTFLKIRNVAPFSSVDYTSDFFVFEIYRVGQQPPSATNQVYYEFGQRYAILDPETDTRRHAGLVTDQSSDYVTPAEINIYNGDSYFRLRNVYLSESGIGSFYVQDRNFLDIYTSAVSSVDGRPSVIDINAKSATYGAVIRFSQAYQPNTNINGLNRFYPNDFIEVDNSYGGIGRLKVRDRFMRVFQTIKIGAIPLFNQISKNADGTTLNVVTDKLLNPIQYYSGDWGIGTAFTSLASYNFADYCIDNNKGFILRISNDGIIPISLKYKVNSWAIDNLPLRTGQYFSYGAYDQKSNNYILALEAAVLSGVFNCNLQQKVKGLPTYFIFTVIGTPVAGDILSIHLVDGNGVEATYEYTAINGDTVFSMVSNLSSLINSDVLFVATNQSIYPDPGLYITQVAMVHAAVFNCTVTVTNSSDVTSPAQTLTFDEETNAFESFLSNHPEMMCTIGTLLISWKNARLWTHNNQRYNSFFGVDYESNITLIFNENALQKKSWNSVTEVASGIWDCPIIKTNVNSFGTTPQETNLVEAEFKLLEGNPSTSIKRDINSRGGKINGSFMKGNYCSIKFRKLTASELVYLSVVSLRYLNSPLTNT